MLKIKRFVFSPFLENTYVIWDEENNSAAVVDPGCLSEDEENQLADFIESEKLKINYLLNTHCHIDHVFGNAFVKNKYDVPYYAPEKDVFLIDMLPVLSKEYGIEMKYSPNPGNYITEDTDLKIGNIQIKFLFTPGHTPGEFCLYFEKDKICITGDVLFKEGIGRTDLWGGNYKTLISSIENKLFSLPDDVEIFPGHGESSTIGYEKAHNPFLINTLQ